MKKRALDWICRSTANCHMLMSPASNTTHPGGRHMNKVEAIIRPEKLEAGFVGMNTVSVTGRGKESRGA